jgi:hypothetical protein
VPNRAETAVPDTFDHIIYRYGLPAERPAVRLDHELEAGEIIEWEGESMRVVAARSEDRDYGRVRIVHLETISEQ